MQVSTEEFIYLIQERPALWQRSHRDFANRDTRIKLLTEIAVAANIDPYDCSKKLKNLKDSMRAQVAKLPKNSLGLPEFHACEHITWPLFKSLLFMKDEFTGRKRAMSYSSSSEMPDVKLEHIDCQSYDLDELSASSSSIPPMITSSMGESSASAKKIKRRRPTSSTSDYDERNLPMLEKVAAPDELDVFASDIANDLRKIKCPLKLMQAKSKIRRIAEDFVMSELVPSSVTGPSQQVPPDQWNWSDSHQVTQN